MEIYTLDIARFAKKSPIEGIFTFYVVGGYHCMDRIASVELYLAYYIIGGAQKEFAACADLGNIADKIGQVLRHCELLQQRVPGKEWEPRFLLQYALGFQCKPVFFGKRFDYVFAE